MQPVWQGLLALHSIIGLFLVFWYGAERWLPSLETLKGRLASGFLLGLVAIIAMVMAVEVVPGYWFDLRSATIATSGMLWGPWAALVTAAMTGTIQLFQGVDGALPGLLNIGISAAIGTAAHFLLRGQLPRCRDCLMLALAEGVASLLALFAITPGLRLTIAEAVWLPLAALTFTTTLLASTLITLVLARQSAFRLNEVYRDMVDALPDCLNSKDLAGRFIVANQATGELMKSGSARNLVGRTDFDFYPKKLAAGFREDDLAVIQSGEPGRFDQLFDFGNGQRGWLSTLKVPMRNAKGEIVGLITHNQDITERRAMNEMRNEFISTVSHEIRTPLTSICGSLRLLEHANGDLPEKAVKLVNIANNNAQHLMELVNNILDLEKFDAGRMNFEPEVVSVRTAVEEAVESMRHFLPDKKLKWKVSHLAPDCTVLVHSGRLRQVMLNLLSNAAKFSPQGGRIKVEITIADGIAAIAFLDEGKGVDPSFEDLLFTRFSQETKYAVKGSKQGTGLGLNLVKIMVEHMSGDVSYLRRDGLTEFRISFPVHEITQADDGPSRRGTGPGKLEVQAD
jgi:PAS domain S-box-containing protein